MPCSAIGLLIIEATRVEIVASIMSTEVGCVETANCHLAAFFSDVYYSMPSAEHGIGLTLVQG